MRSLRMACAMAALTLVPGVVAAQDTYRQPRTFPYPQSTYWDPSRPSDSSDCDAIHADLQDATVLAHSYNGGGRKVFIVDNFPTDHYDLQGKIASSFIKCYAYPSQLGGSPLLTDADSSAFYAASQDGKLAYFNAVIQRINDQNGGTPCNVVVSWIATYLAYLDTQHLVSFITNGLGSVTRGGGVVVMCGDAVIPQANNPQGFGDPAVRDALFQAHVIVLISPVRAPGVDVAALHASPPPEPCEVPTNGANPDQPTSFSPAKQADVVTLGFPGPVFSYTTTSVAAALACLWSGHSIDGNTLWAILTCDRRTIPLYHGRVNTGTLTVVAPDASHVPFFDTAKVRDEIHACELAPPRFTDVPPNFPDAEQAAAIVNLGNRAVISGYSDGTFRPFAPVTRGQTCKIVVNALGFQQIAPATPHFWDTPSTNVFYPFIETLFARGAITGYSDGSFRPYNNVTRGQLTKIVTLSRGWSLSTSTTGGFADSSGAFAAYIQTALDHGAIHAGTPEENFDFFPWDNALRGFVAQTVHLAEQR